NWFYHAFQRGQDPLVREWQSWRAPTWANPLIPPEDIDEARAVLPRRVFEQEYEAAFLQNGGAVFRGVRDAVCTEPRSPAAARRCVMGVDFGRYHDFTAAVVIDADARPVPAVVAVDRYNEANWAVQRARLAALARRWSVQAILAEANAMGEPNIDALRAEGLPVEAFVTTAQSKPRLIESLASAVESGGIALPDHAQLLAELESFTYELNPRTNHTQYGAPPGLHDDTVIALALAWHLVCTPRLSLGIAEVGALSLRAVRLRSRRGFGVGWLLPAPDRSQGAVTKRRGVVRSCVPEPPPSADRMTVARKMVTCGYSPGSLFHI